MSRSCNISSSRRFIVPLVKSSPISMSSYSSMTGNLVSPTGSTTPTYNTHPFPPPPTTTSKPSSASKTSSFHRQPTLVVGHKDNSPQPADIAYFTGNPVYYKHLSMLNSLIREYQYLQTVVVEATQLQAASSPISTPTLYPLNFYHPKSSSHLPINPIEYESPSSSSSTSSSEASLAPYEREKLKLPLWMNRQQFRDLKDIRLPTRSMYEDFIHKLNLLFYARGKVVCRDGGGGLYAVLVDYSPPPPPPLSLPQTHAQF